MAWFVDPAARVRAQGGREGHENGDVFLPAFTQCMRVRCNGSSGAPCLFPFCPLFYFVSVQYFFSCMPLNPCVVPEDDPSSCQ